MRTWTRWALPIPDADVAEREGSSQVGMHLPPPSPRRRLTHRPFGQRRARTHANHRRIECTAKLMSASVSLIVLHCSLALVYVNLFGSVGQTSVFLCPPLSLSPLFCSVMLPSDRQTEANSPWDIRTWNILFSHSTTRRRHRRRRPPLARSANVPLPAPSAPSLRGE